jgi:methionyl-tRNA formyltransferase
MTWLILSGECRIPVTLLEAVDQVDAGSIYLQDWIDLTDQELSSEWRQLQADATLRLCERFISEYPSIISKAWRQEGEVSFYPRRRPKDSELNPNKTIAEQFNVLRVVDNNRYPAFFKINGKAYTLTINEFDCNNSNY